MKRSGAVTLTLIPAVVAATCGTERPDPCVPATYSAEACQYAVDHQGYYHNGLWIAHGYSRPFLFYSNGYSNYVAGGGQVRALGSQAFAVPAGGRGIGAGPGAAGARAGGGASATTRGGFGGIGSGHVSSGS